MSAAQQLRYQGQAAVLAADTSVMRGYADLVVEAVESFDGKVAGTFDAEMVRDYIERHYPDARPHSANVLPAVLGSLASAGRIRAVGHTRCTRSSRRHGWMRVWQVVPTGGAA